MADEITDEDIVHAAEIEDEETPHNLAWLVSSRTVYKNKVAELEKRLAKVARAKSRIQVKLEEHSREVRRLKNELGRK
jgi:hypothetical protein